MSRSDCLSFAKEGSSKAPQADKKQPRVGDRRLDYVCEDRLDMQAGGKQFYDMRMQCGSIARAQVETSRE